MADRLGSSAGWKPTERDHDNMQGAGGMAERDLVLSEATTAEYNAALGNMPDLRFFGLFLCGR